MQDLSTKKYKLDNFFYPIQCTSTIRPINTNNDYDLLFTYRILKKRFHRKNIDIKKQNKLPSFEEHVSFLKNTNLYKHFYITSYREYDVHVFFVTRESNEMGFYLCPHNIKLILKHYYDELVTKTNNIHLDISLGQKIGMWISKEAVCCLLQIDNSLYDNIYATIREDNLYSRLVAKYVGFVQI